MSFGFHFCRIIGNELIKNVTRVGDYGFEHCDRITKIPDGMVTIGHSAFRSCALSEIVYLPNSVLSLGRFSLCDTRMKYLLYCGNWDFSYHQLIFGFKPNIKVYVTNLYKGKKFGDVVPIFKNECKINIITDTYNHILSGSYLKLHKRR